MDEEMEPIESAGAPQGGKTRLIAGAIIVAALLVVLFVYPGVANDYLSKDSRTKVLVIGEATQEITAILNDNRETIVYDTRTPESLARNSLEQIKENKIIILDQSESASKEISKDLGEAIQGFVKKGGNLIVIMDSGTKRPDTSDVMGWGATFGEIIPVECARTGNNAISCAEKNLVSGKLMRKAEEHPIMQGIDMYPLEEGKNSSFETFAINLTGTEIAYIESAGIDGKSYTGIAEKKTGLGKVIYFNYNAGKTRGIFENTLNYLG